MRRIAACLSLLALLAACDPNAGRSPGRGRVPEPTTASGGARATRAQDPIVVEAPQDGEELTSPVVLSGSANVYEATVTYRIVTVEGDVAAKGFTTATCGSGCRGTFSVTVPFKVERPTPATVRVYAQSAEDGSPQHEVKVRVTLLP